VLLEQEGERGVQIQNASPSLSAGNNIMTPEQEAHIEKITNDFKKEAYAKYTKGQEEHGGDLWRKKHILDMLMEECMDFYIYAHTVRQQLENLGIELGEIDDKA
jgi:hypothetical protein